MFLSPSTTSRFLFFVTSKYSSAKNINVLTAKLCGYFNLPLVWEWVLDSTTQTLAATLISPARTFNFKATTTLLSSFPTRLAFVRSFRFTKYYYIGLGYKLFVYLKRLFVWVGLTHYTLLRLPPLLKILTRKRRIFLVSRDKASFSNFLASIRRIRKMDIYKGKGLLEVKSYKGFIKMKSGKKKQY